MKRILVFILTCALLFGITSYAKEEEPKQLYAQSAVLMDADSGRVLFEKNGYEQKAMASTTKIMTCIGVGKRKTRSNCHSVRECGKTAESTFGNGKWRTILSA